MPVDKTKYHPEWDKISLSVKESAEWKCHLCGAEHGKPHWKTGSIVVLTVHHRDHDPGNNEKKNMAALCQRCHLWADQPFHIKNRLKKNKDKNQKELFKENS